ncbi:MAG TPA: hypothetical protein VHM20_02175 [Gammaproteobacteria bacterium]|jgi:hypothetical protein|nr:hypothetical protein [Gammaproteobacteria bacterium]
MNKKKPLVKSSNSLDTIFFLIAQELKIRRLFNALHSAGIEGSSFEPCLDKLIFAEMGIEEVTDKVIQRYCDIIDQGSMKIEPNRKSIQKQSHKVYRELLAETGKRKK